MLQRELTAFSNKRSSLELLFNFTTLLFDI